MLRLGIVLFPGFQVMGLAMTTVFEFANITANEAVYEIKLLSEHGGLIPSSGGFSVSTEPFDRRRFDTIIVGGDNEAVPASSGLLSFLRGATRTSRRIGATCTGAFALAEAGLLNGRRATTHWYHALELQRTYPEVKVEQDCIFIIDGPVWTSAGMTAGIDLALALVEKDLGADIARQVAKKLVVYHRRAGGQLQFSALLELEPRSDRVQTALAYARQNLQAELSVEQLAESANLSPRQFSRAFRAETGQSPAKAIEQLRVEAAQLMMESGKHPMEVIARETGFGDRERMRRAFLRAFGQPPQVMQRATRTHSARN